MNRLPVLLALLIAAGCAAPARELPMATPGKTVRVPLKTDVDGSYVVLCDHYCGSGHGNMKMTIVVQ